MKTLLLFDIDGTLLRAKDATRRAMLRSFRDIFGTEKTIEDINFLGRTDPELFQQASVKVLGHRLDVEDYTSLTERYVTLLPEELARCVFRLMPGVEPLLAHLSTREDVILGLETGNLEPAAFLKLKRGTIDHYFAFGGFGSDNEDRTELVRIAIERARNLNNDFIPDENVFVIGDAPDDIIAGRNLGVNTLAVGTGRTDRNTLLAESPSCLLPDLSDMSSFMQYIGL
ncbi:Pyrophosphatase PpaX [subsurface metagenome]